MKDTSISIQSTCTRYSISLLFILISISSFVNVSAFTVHPSWTTKQFGRVWNDDHRRLDNSYRSQKNRWISSINFKKQNPTSTRLNSVQNSNKLSKSSLFSKSKSGVIYKDVLVVGGGLAGLSIALSLAQSGRQVTILEKNDEKAQYSKSNTAGSFAAAGMLAPQSERLPMGPLLDLCLQSRKMYTDFVQNVELLARNAGTEGKTYLWNHGHPEGKLDSTSKDNCLEPWEVGFQATGGFLAPAFAGDSVATWAPPAGGGVAYWLDEIQVRELEPQLHQDVVGGWWFPEDASVDARRLTCSLRAACIEAGVHILMGSDVAAASLELSDGKCNGVHLVDGRIFDCNSIVVANGSWMRELLPVPITPHKGQSFSLRMPANTSPILSRVLFAQDTYIVPKSDGRIIVGATVEPGSYDPNVTPAGMIHCMQNAIALVPALADLPLEETWSGLRPTTPDKGPILGKTAWDNLFVAGGYWRNGVLLAPKTAQLISDLINDCLTDDDQALLNEFSWDRFTSPDGGAKIAAASRYAASMHPVHNRATGMGISASVGTELGFYSGAGAAESERKRDREALFGDAASMDDAFEKAANLGKRDILGFSKSNPSDQSSLTAIEKAKSSDSQKHPEQQMIATPTEALSDAITVGFADGDQTDLDNSSKNILGSTYDAIKANKAKVQHSIEMGETKKDDRSDPGFRIFHVDSKTGEKRLVPPYTSEGALLNSIAAEKSKENEHASDIQPFYDEEKTKSSSEALYDGYSAIQEANGSISRENELSAMKKARQKNRKDSSEIDESRIGAMKPDDTYIENSKTLLADQQLKNNNIDELITNPKSVELQSFYEKIQKNKNKQKANILMGDKVDEDRPKLDFKIYHVDNETGEKRLVPPYTTQAAMEKIVTNEKQKQTSDIVNTSIIDSDTDNNVNEENVIDDGYSEIQKANGSANRDEELDAMRKDRQSNRFNFG